LLYCEDFPDIAQAISREKQIKGWTRAKKLALIQSVNPNMDDLSAQSNDSSLRKSPLRSNLLRSE
jgi:putative endonuclease